jgi:heterodisulfide reductase subunit B
MKFGLYLGCQIPFIRPDLEVSIRKTLPLLGVKIIDLEGYSCCPTWVSAPSFDEDAWLAISARNISIAEENGVDIVTGCNNCYSVLSHARYLLKDEERREKVNRILGKVGRFYRGKSKIYHITHVLSDFVGKKKLKENLEYSLDGMVVAVQPGCHMLWPTRIMDVQEENPFYPQKLKNLVELLGAKSPYYSRIEYCCGAGPSIRAIDYEKSAYFVLTKLMSIKEEVDPDFIVTGCSTCYIQLDETQQKLRKEGKVGFQIPVFYYTQILAICMGIEPDSVVRIGSIPKEDIIGRILESGRR